MTDQQYDMIMEHLRAATRRSEYSIALAICIAPSLAFSVWLGISVILAWIVVLASSHVSTRRAKLLYRQFTGDPFVA